MDKQQETNNLIGSVEQNLDSSRSLEMGQIVLLKKQIRYLKILCILLACLTIAIIVIAVIVIPDMMETMKQMTELLEKINEQDGEKIDKLTDAIDKLNLALKLLPFGG